MTSVAIARKRTRNSSFGQYRWIQISAVVAIVFGFLWFLWHFTAHAVSVSVDGVDEIVRTHRRTVAGLVLDLDIDLQPQDRVTPSVDSLVRSVGDIKIQRARSYQISVDGRTLSTASWHNTPRRLLEDAGITIDKYDKILVGGSPVGLDDELPRPALRSARSVYQGGREWSRIEMDPLQLQISRAVPITVDDSGIPFVVRTTAQTVGEALRQAEIMIFLGDRVEPNLGSEVSTGLRVAIERSTPLTLFADGQLTRTRTRAKTVADALVEMHVGLSGLDRVQPELSSELYEGIKIELIRVQQDVEVEEEIAPFETIYVPDTGLPIDTQQVVNAGAEGITRSRFRLQYEDGVEVEKVLEDRWIAQEPDERVISYGQRIDPKIYSAQDGTQLTYWRKIRMLASSYSAGTAGVSPDKAYYGRTYTGETMRHGVVAVDPSVIALRSRVFVSGYGPGEALDIGSAIRARRIDLGYDDDNLVLWNKWVDVYLLWPPPAASEITWVVPNWPRPPQ